MSYVTIGDLHGKDVWKNIDFNLSNKYIFLGDYVDSYDLTDQQILDNLKEIIELKKNYPDNIILLLGNHDAAYLKRENNVSGFRYNMSIDLYDIFNRNIKLFQMSYQKDNYLWTHAGIHIGWWKLYGESILSKNKIVQFSHLINDNTKVSDLINMMFEFNYEPLYMVSLNRGGRHRVPGPLWTDKIEIYKKPLNGYHHIVGHNVVNDIKTYNINNNTKITFCDCLDNQTKFFVV